MEGGGDLAWLDISADAFTDKQPKLEHELWRGRFQDSVKTSVQISSLAESLPRLREGEGQCYSYISSSPSAGFPSVSVCALYCCTVVKWGKHFITIGIYITQHDYRYVKYIVKIVWFLTYQNLYSVFLLMSIPLRYTCN